MTVLDNKDSRIRFINRDMLKYMALFMMGVGHEMGRARIIV